MELKIYLQRVYTFTNFKTDCHSLSFHEIVIKGKGHGHNVSVPNFIHDFYNDVCIHKLLLYCLDSTVSSQINIS